MSTATVQEPRKRLNEAQKRAIAAEIIAGEANSVIARRYNVHRNTISTIRKSVQDVPQSPLSTSWRSRLTETMPLMSVDAMERSITDQADPHKAASTAIAHLKGIGVLAGEGNSTVNVFVGQVLNLPADWQSEYLSVESTPTIEATATEWPADPPTT